MNKEDLKKLEQLDNKYLFDVVENYKKYNYTIEARDKALAVLKDRNIPKEDLLCFYEGVTNRKGKAKKIKNSLDGYYQKIFLFGLLYGFLLILLLIGIGSNSYLLSSVAFFSSLGAVALQTNNVNAFIEEYDVLAKNIHSDKYVKILKPDSLPFYLLGVIIFVYLTFYYIVKCTQAVGSVSEQ